MGLRKDLDSIQKRYIYHLISDRGVVLYVGTSVNPKSRYKSHLKRSKTENSIFYKYVRENNISFTCKIVKELTSTYQFAEQEEIKEIQKHKDTCLNFYNNPNKKGIKNILKKQ
jgi:hypothetical protein